MLLLVTIGLVLVGAVSLVIGFVSNSLGPIYLSIGCSVIAGIVLVIFSRMSRREPTTAAAPSQFRGAPESPGWTPPSPAPVGGEESTAVFSPPDTAAPPRDEVAPRPSPPPAPAPAPVPSAVAVEDEEFPIEDYDQLRASQILALLPELDLDELDLVREREERGKRRNTILRTVDELIDELEAEQAGAVEPVAPEGAAAAPGPDEGFPIDDYDRLSVDQILPLLDELDDDELDMVAEREEQGQNRAEILDRIDELFEEPVEAPPPAVAEPVAPAPVAEPVAAPPPPAAEPVPAMPVAEEPGAVPAPAQEAPVKRAPAKRAPAKKAPAKKAPAKKVPAVKEPAASMPVEEVPLKRAPAKRAPAKKVAVEPAAAEGVLEAVTAPQKAAAKRAPTKRPPAEKGPVSRKLAASGIEPPPTGAPAKKAPAKAAAKAVVKKAPGKKAAGKKAPPAAAPTKLPPAKKAGARKAPAKKA